MSEGRAAQTTRARRREKRAEWEHALLRDVGTRLRAARKQADLTIAELATRVALDPAYLGEVERGRENVSLTTLAALTRALGLSSVASLLPPLEPPALLPSQDG